MPHCRARAMMLGRQPISAAFRRRWRPPAVTEALKLSRCITGTRRSPPTFLRAPSRPVLDREPCTCGNGKAKIFGVRGPHAALAPVAELYGTNYTMLNLKTARLRLRFASDPRGKTGRGLGPKSPQKLASSHGFTKGLTAHSHLPTSILTALGDQQRWNVPRD